MAPMGAIADKLNCTIDAVVGRDEAEDSNGRDLNALYRSLFEEGKKRLDDYPGSTCLRLPARSSRKS